MSPSRVCVVVVTLTPLPGQGGEVIRIIHREWTEIRATPGCLSYDIFAEVDGAVVLIERWHSRESWQAHFDTPAIVRLKRDLTPLLAKPATRREMYAVET